MFGLSLRFPDEWIGLLMLTDDTEFKDYSNHSKFNQDNIVTRYKCKWWTSIPYETDTHTNLKLPCTSKQRYRTNIVHHHLADCSNALNSYVKYSLSCFARFRTRANVVKNALHSVFLIIEGYWSCLQYSTHMHNKLSCWAKHCSSNKIAKLKLSCTTTLKQPKQFKILATLHYNIENFNYNAPENSGSNIVWLSL